MDIKTKPQKKRTNKEKIAICDKYQDYIKIIYYFGNKIMLMKQLEEYARKLGLANAHSTFMYHLKELYEYDILKAEPLFVSNRKTQHHILILKKFALRYMVGETGAGGSQKVAPVPPLRSNDRIMAGMFRNSFLLEKIIPRLQKEKGKVDVDDIFAELKNLHSSLLFNKNQGINYAEKFYQDFSDLINPMEFKEQMETLRNDAEKRQNGLKKGSKSSEGKGKASLDRSGAGEGNAEQISVAIDMEQKEQEKAKEKEPKKDGKVSMFANKKDEKIYNFTFESMVRANMNIVRIDRGKNSYGTDMLMITILIFDYKNSQDLYMFGTQIACVYLMFKQLLLPEVELNLKVAIVAMDAEASASMKTEADETVRNPFSQVEGKRMELTLKNWRIAPTIQEKITITYSHYDITNRYLEGKKFANLLQGRPKSEEKEGK